MKFRIVLFFTFVSLFSSKISFSQSSFSDEQAIKMLKSFYTEYIGEISIMPMNEEKVQKIKNKYCSEKLINTLNAQEFDNDPFINAQDCEIELLKILNFKKKVKTDNTFIVSYLDNATRNLISIELIVIITDEIYKIDDIIEEKSKF